MMFTATDALKLTRKLVLYKNCGVFVLSRCFLDFSVGVEAFVIGLSDLFLFLSLNVPNKVKKNFICK